MEVNKKRVGIYTLGCKVNQYESEAIAEEFERLGYDIVPPTLDCDAFVINTCTVTAESDRKARQFIRRAISKNPFAVIAVTGCMAETAPDSIAAIAGVDVVVGNSDKLSLVKKVDELIRKNARMDSPFIDSGRVLSSGFESMRITHFDRTRAYIKIEDGCDSHCAYCIIPSARGHIRSKPMNEVLEEVRYLTDNGCKEVVLTGIETASYGKDLEDGDLAALLEAVDAIDGIGRVRLGSLDPSLIKPDFVRRIAKLKSLAPHFHLSLQSGSDRILALMKRKYNSSMAMRAIELLREAIPGVKFTTDVIVGFPGETEEDFLSTVDFVKRAGFLMVHVFPYSKRKGTVAAVMKEQISGDEKSDRLHRLAKTAEEVRNSILKEKIALTPIVSVLFESYENGVAYGHTADFAEVAALSPSPIHGELREVRLTELKDGVCHGVIIPPKGE